MATVDGLARYDRPPPSLADYDDLLTRKRLVTTTTGKTTTVDAAAQASIGAAARELHLPGVRTEATRLAEIADRERHTHLRDLAEVLPPRSTTVPNGAAPVASTRPSSHG